MKSETEIYPENITKSFTKDTFQILSQKRKAYVYLTSHNRIADDINTKKLNELGGKTYQFKAKIVGDFKESQFPNEEVLELKVGAQVMFIRNDATQEKNISTEN